MLTVFKSFNPKEYKKIAKTKFGASLGFLVIFVIILSVFFSFKYTAVIKTFIPKISYWAQTNLSDIFSDVPGIEISDGMLVSPKSNYIKKWEADNEEFYFVIEPSGEKVFPMLADFTNVLVLTDTKVIAKYSKPNTNESEIKMYKLDNIKHLQLTPITDGINVSLLDDSFDITGDLIEAFIDQFSWVIFPLIFLWLSVMYFLHKMIQLFFFSLLSVIVNKKLKRELTYKQLLTIGVYAMVTPTTLTVVKEIFNIRIPAFWLIYLGIYVFYLFSGIKSVDMKKEEEPKIKIEEGA
ncbi:MAG: DUF1189 family protein [Candidatus Omnitrophota bacterium]|nr:DUF1189 domain-containing protein [Candidatus Omnitrophota bacterium]